MTATESPERQIEIPAGALVKCPKVKNQLVHLNACVRCEHYGELAERFPNPHMKFNERFMVACRFPTGRVIEMLAEQA